MRELEEEFTEIAGSLAANKCGDSMRTDRDFEEKTAAPGQLLIIRNIYRPILDVGELCKSTTQAQKTFKEQNNNPDVR